jgi:hypothetical protein
MPVAANNVQEFVAPCVYGIVVKLIDQTRDVNFVRRHILFCEAPYLAVFPG